MGRIRTIGQQVCLAHYFVHLSDYNVAREGSLAGRDGGARRNADGRRRHPGRGLQREGAVAGRRIASGEVEVRRAAAGGRDAGDVPVARREVSPRQGHRAAETGRGGEQRVRVLRALHRV